MRKGEGWLTAGILGIGVVFTVALGIYSLTSAPPLHPNPQDVPSVSGAAPPPRWRAAVDQGRQLARAGLVQQNLPGLSVAVGVKGELVWAEGFGWADVENRVPVAPGMRFRIGHVSKTLTSAAVGVLLEQERLRLDAEIQSYVPDFPRKQWPITLRQLMANVSGIRHYAGEAEYMSTAHCERARDGLPVFADDPLRFEPETRYGYSTFGWVLVSAAVEAVAGESFFTFMRTKIFEPAGMRETTVDSNVERIPNRANFYYPRFSGDPKSGSDFATSVDYSCFAGAGAFLSTPSDLVRFGSALGNGTLLEPATVEKLQRRQVLESGAETEYGLGWMLHTTRLAGEPTPEAGHASRTLLGGSASFLTFPERGIVVAVTANISKADTRQIAIEIADAFAKAAAGN